MLKRNLGGGGGGLGAGKIAVTKWVSTESFTFKRNLGGGRRSQRRKSVPNVQRS